MQAVVQDSYGSTDVLELRQIDRPDIADDEVLVEVRATGVDRGVLHLMTGLPYVVRLAGYGLRAPKTPVPGLDVSGVVVAVGMQVTRFSVGDEVMGVARGAFAEYAAALESKLVHKPEALAFEQASVVAISGLTALQAVRDHGQVTQGSDVLVLGASGGVGSFTVQIAKAYGATVTGVCSTQKVEMVQSLGADHVIDYCRTDFSSTGKKYDVIIDIGGNTRLSGLRRALQPDGILVITGGETRGRLLGGTDRQLRAMLLSPFVGQTLKTFIASENHEDLQALRILVEAGTVIPYVDRTFPLEQATDALQYVADGHARGKVVVSL